MEKLIPRVIILGNTDYKENVSILYQAFRECYSDIPAIDMIMEDLPSYGKQIDFINDKIKKGHISAIEHVKITFAVADVSRSLLAQLTRHRHASFSVKSQRYTTVSKNGEFDYVLPEIFLNQPRTKKKYQEIMKMIGNGFDELMELAMSETGKSKQELKQDVRYVLPNSSCTSLVLSMNFSSLLHFLGLRLCSRASLEIRRLAETMLKLLQETYPLLFDNIGPKCVSLGRCPENKTGKLCKVGLSFKE